jgi:hypothetical protein
MLPEREGLSTVKSLAVSISSDAFAVTFDCPRFCCFFRRDTFLAPCARTNDHPRRPSIPHTLRCTGIAGNLNRFRSVVLIERSSIQPWRFSGQDAKRVIPTGVFRTSDIEQMRMGVLEHLGDAQAPAWLFAAKLREGTVIRLPLSEQYQSLPCGLPAAGCPPKFAFSSNIWRRLSRSAPSSIHDPANRNVWSSRWVILCRFECDGF